MKKEFELPIKLSEEEQELTGIEAIYPIVEEAFKLKDMLTSLAIETEDDLAVANGKAIDAKKLSKKVVAKRKELSEPYDKARKQLLEIEKRILTPLTDGIEDLTSRIVAYQDLLEKKQKEEVKKLEVQQGGLDALKEELKKLEVKIYKSIDIKTTMPELQAVAKKAVYSKEGDSVLQKFVAKANSKDITELAALTKERCKRYGKAKKEVIEGGDDNMDMLRSVLEQEMDDSLLITTNQEAVAIQSKIESTSSKKAITSIRKNIKYQLMDINALDAKYKITEVADGKVKEFLKEIKDKETFMQTIEDHPDNIIAGLRFYIEKTHVGR